LSFPTLVLLDFLLFARLFLVLKKKRFGNSFIFRRQGTKTTIIIYTFGGSLESMTLLEIHKKALSSHTTNGWESTIVVEQKRNAFTVYPLYKVYY
jgi:hypothetical protein